MKQLFVLPLLALLVASALAGCGSGNAASDSQASCPGGKFLPETGKRGEQFSAPPAMSINTKRTYRACISTSKGDMVVTLTPKTAPIAVNNFVFLATHRFYTTILFHRVIKGFMVQTGDPTGTGTGGPGYSFQIENGGTNFSPGTLAYANTGQPNSNGSQFFICSGAQCASLGSAAPPGYTIFGHVTSGMSVVKALAAVPVRAGSSGEVSSPKQPIYMKSVRIYSSP